MRRTPKYGVGCQAGLSLGSAMTFGYLATLLVPFRSDFARNGEMRLRRQRG
jgi:hypothetical protein